MVINKFEIWISDMNPGMGTEPGKIRPVLIVQSDLLHQLGHISTIVCPISSQKRGISKLRISVEQSKLNGLQKPSSIVIDQIKAVDFSRLKNKIGELETKYHNAVKKALQLVLDI
ncbi:MAG: type II toxin-antitoxin system PemK/MazF family toxin [Pelobium sp.]